MKKAGRPFGKTGKAEVLTDNDLKVVIYDVLRSGKNALRNTAIIVMSHRLGLRAKEISSLQVRDVYDGKNIKKTLRLFAKYTKGHKHRDLPMTSQTLISTLNRYMHERVSQDGLTFSLDAPLFRSQKGSYFSAGAMVRLIKNIYLDSGYENASSHSGRRSLLTKLANRGVSAFHIREVAGHSSIMTTQQYIDTNPIILENILSDD